MAATYYSGTAGRVATGSGNVAIAGVTSWKLDKQGEVIPTTNFESTADANGTVWETYVKGIAKCTGSLEGIFNGDTTSSEDSLPIGTTVTLDLLFDKTSLDGYTDLSAMITGFQPSHDLRQVGKFTCTFTVNGVPATA